MNVLWLTNLLLVLLIGAVLYGAYLIKQFIAQFRIGIMDPVQRVYYDRQGIFVTDFFEFIYSLDDFYEAADYRGIIEMNVSRILRIGFEKFDQEELVRTGKFTALMEQLLIFQESPYMPLSLNEKVLGLLEAVDENLNVILRQVTEECFKASGVDTQNGDASYSDLVSKVETLFNERMRAHEGQWEALITEVRILIG